MGYVHNVKLEIIPSTKKNPRTNLSQEDKILLNISAVNKLKIDYLRENMSRRSLYKKGIITNKHDVLVSPDEFYNSIRPLRKKTRVLIGKNGLDILEGDDEMSDFYDNYEWILNNRINVHGLFNGLLESRSDIVHNIRYGEDLPTVMDYMSDVYNYYSVDVSCYQKPSKLKIENRNFWIPSLRKVKFVEPDRIPVNYYILRLLIRHDIKTNKYYAHFYYITDYKASRKDMTQGVGIYLSGIPYLTLCYEDGTLKTFDSFETNEEICKLVSEKNELDVKMKTCERNREFDEYQKSKNIKHEIHTHIQEVIYDKINEYIDEIVKDNPEYISMNRPEYNKMRYNYVTSEKYFNNYTYLNYLYEFSYYKYFYNKMIEVCQELDIPLFISGIGYYVNKYSNIKSDYFRICSECGGLDKREYPLLEEYFECSNPECKNFGSGNQNIKYNENCAKILCKIPFTHKDEFKDNNDRSNHIILNICGITDRMGYDDINNDDIEESED